jgi:hypothetical protein
VIEPLPTILIVASLILAAVVGVYVALNRIPDWTLLGLTGVVELLAVVQVVGSTIALIRTDRDVDVLTFVGYLFAILVVLPLAFFWSLAERSRGATAVLLVAALTVAYLVLRLVQVWDA